VDDAIKAGVPLLPSRIEQMEAAMYESLTPEPSSADIQSKDRKRLKVYCIENGEVERMVACTNAKTAQLLLKVNNKDWVRHVVSHHPVDALIAKRQPGRVFYSNLRKRSHRLRHYHPTEQQAYKDKAP
jgi:hypothetical protein